MVTATAWELFTFAPVLRLTSYCCMEYIRRGCPRQDPMRSAPAGWGDAGGEYLRQPEILGMRSWPSLAVSSPEQLF